MSTWWLWSVIQLHENSKFDLTFYSVVLSISLCSPMHMLPTNRPVNFGLSWVLLAVPLLLSMTLFAERPVILSLFILTSTGFLLLIPHRESGASLPSNQPVSPTVSAPKQPWRTWIRPLPAMTTYRAYMMLMTVPAILAVDFLAVPRSLAKCETYGVSLVSLPIQL